MDPYTLNPYRTLKGTLFEHMDIMTLLEEPFKEPLRKPIKEALKGTLKKALKRAF